MRPLAVLVVRAAGRFGWRSADGVEFRGFVKGEGLRVVGRSSLKLWAAPDLRQRLVANTGLIDPGGGFSHFEEMIMIDAFGEDGSETYLFFGFCLKLNIYGVFRFFGIEIE